jgi:hypothetical protein
VPIRINAIERRLKMAKRNSRQQSKHDQMVKQIANSYSKKGWSVQADIPGYEQPDGIGKKNRILDVLVKKGRAEHLIEVETKDTMKKDKDQHETFIRSAAHKPGRVFKIRKTK